MNTQIEKIAKKIRSKLDKENAIHLVEYLPKSRLGTVKLVALHDKQLTVDYYIDPIFSDIASSFSISENSDINEKIDEVMDEVNKDLDNISGTLVIDIDDEDFLNLLKKLPKLDQFYSDFKLDTFDVFEERIPDNYYIFDSTNDENVNEDDVEKYNLYEIFEGVSGVICNVESEKFYTLEHLIEKMD